MSLYTIKHLNAAEYIDMIKQTQAILPTRPRLPSPVDTLIADFLASTAPIWKWTHKTRPSKQTAILWRVLIERRIVARSLPIYVTVVGDSLFLHSTE